MKPVAVYFLFLFGCIGGVLKSQSFTNGSVFNYSVGDTIVTMFEYIPNGSGPVTPTIKYRVFTGKKISANADTVFYTHIDTDWTPHYPFPGTITTGTNSFFVTNLNASVIDFTLLATTDTCSVLTETTYITTCGLYAHQKQLGTKPACFPNWKQRSWLFIEGIGSFYSEMKAGGSPYLGWKTSLSEFYKAGPPPCGFVGNIPTGIVTNRSESIKLFPNPSNGELILRNPERQSLEVIITDLSGKTVWKASTETEAMPLRLSIPRGIYQASILSDGVVIKREKLMLFPE